MRIVRWAAAAVTILMSLMNLPFAVDAGGILPPPAPPGPSACWACSASSPPSGCFAAPPGGVRQCWLSAVNLAGAVAAMIMGMEGAVIGLVVSSLIVVLGLLTRGSEHAEPVSYRRGVI